MSESSRSRSKRLGEKLTTIYPVDQSLLTETIKNIVLKLDDEGNLIALPVVLVDPSTNPMKLGNPSLTQLHSGNFTTGALTQAIWTPTAGLRFRLYGYILSLSSDVAEAADDNLGVQVLDGANIMFRHITNIPAVSIATGSTATIFSVQFPGNGYRSLLPNNVLTITIAANLTAGRIGMNAWGIEEL
jgi:hypothetical protein